MGVLDKLSGIKVPQTRTAPLWAGPQDDGDMGGVTQGLIARYLVCKERFRIQVIEGWKSSEGFSHKLEFGSMWHAAEEAFAGQFGAPSADTGWKATSEATATYKPWNQAINGYAQQLSQRYPLQRPEIAKWADIVRMQFPLYVKHWQDHPDVQNRTPLLQEQVFHVPYTLPSGRTVHLRGKWDAVDLIQRVSQPNGTFRLGDKGIWLFETKTKGTIREQQLQKQLTRDSQTMTYLVALEEAIKLHRKGGDVGLPEGALTWPPILGVRYNVIKRPLSGGKGDIKQSKGTKGSKCPKCKGEKKVPIGYDRDGTWSFDPCPKCKGAGRIGAKPPETKEAYYARLAKYITDEPQNWFMRWTVHITPADVQRFRRECLDPILENMADDYEWWTYCQVYHPTLLFDGKAKQKQFPKHCPRHFLLPFGIWSPLLDGGMTDIDEYINTGSTVGLTQVKDLFPELREVTWQPAP